MLPDAAPQDAFERLRGLPFVELSSDGLVIHDTVREVVAAYLRASDPDRSRRYRIAAWRQLRDEVTRATSHEMWRYTADLLYILENPAVREGFFPTSEHRYFVEPAQRRGLAGDPRDRGGVRAARVGGHPRGLVAPPARRVLDGPRRRRRASPGSPWRSSSTVCRARCSTPIRSPGSCATTSGGCPSRAASGSCASASSARTPDDPNHALVVAALILDVKRDVHGAAARAAPHLQRPARAVRAGVAVDDARLPDASSTRRSCSAASRTTPTSSTSGPASVDGWLTRIIATELQVDEDSILDVAQHQLVLADRRVALTKLEFEVFKYLYERPGAVVERASLLRDVWGYDYAGGSNVIEALVKSLRRKLGDRSAAIETVRGLGYRFVATA